MKLVNVMSTSFAHCSNVAKKALSLSALLLVFLYFFLLPAQTVLRVQAFCALNIDSVIIGPDKLMATTFSCYTSGEKRMTIASNVHIKTHYRSKKAFATTKTILIRFHREWKNLAIKINHDIARHRRSIVAFFKVFSSLR